MPQGRSGGSARVVRRAMVGRNAHPTAGSLRCRSRHAVIPAQAGIACGNGRRWPPACAGVTGARGAQGAGSPRAVGGGGGGAAGAGYRVSGRALPGPLDRQGSGAAPGRAGSVTAKSGTFAKL